MEGFIQLIDNKNFTQFILNDYFPDSDMTDEEKINEVGSSLYDYATAMESFELKSKGRDKH
jgi:hypothetical protein